MRRSASPMRCISARRGVGGAVANSCQQVGPLGRAGPRGAGQGGGVGAVGRLRGEIGHGQILVDATSSGATSGQPSWRLGDVDEQGRVVARLRTLAGVAVDEGPGHPVGEGGRQQDQVDAHAPVLGEVPGPVVPPAEQALGGRVLLSERIAEAQRLELADRGPLLGRDVGRALERRHAPHVDVVGRDVDVAAHRPRDTVAPPSATTWSRSRASHRSLYRKCSWPTARPLGTYTDDTRTPPHVAVTSRASWSSGFAVGEARHRVVEADTAEDRDTVPAPLAVVDRVVAPGVELEGRERGVGELGLLQAQHVGLGDVEPSGDAVDALAGERVDVPGGDAHCQPSAASGGASAPVTSGTTLASGTASAAAAPFLDGVRLDGDLLAAVLSAGAFVAVADAFLPPDRLAGFSAVGSSAAAFFAAAFFAVAFLRGLLRRRLLRRPPPGGRRPRRPLLGGLSRGVGLAGRHVGERRLLGGRRRGRLGPCLGGEQLVGGTLVGRCRGGGPRGGLLRGGPLRGRLLGGRLLCGRLLGGSPLGGRLRGGGRLRPLLGRRLRRPPGPGPRRGFGGLGCRAVALGGRVGHVDRQLGEQVGGVGRLGHRHVDHPRQCEVDAAARCVDGDDDEPPLLAEADHLLGAARGGLGQVPQAGRTPSPNRPSRRPRGS